MFAPPPPVPLEEGLARMARWVLSRGPAVPIVFDEIEIARNLPPSWAQQLSAPVSCAPERADGYSRTPA